MLRSLSCVLGGAQPAKRKRAAPELSQRQRHRRGRPTWRFVEQWPQNLFVFKSAKMDKKAKRIAVGQIKDQIKTANVEDMFPDALSKLLTGL